MAKNNIRNIKLTSVDDLFSSNGGTGGGDNNDPSEQIVEIPISEITDFPDHPFRVEQNEAMRDMVESIKNQGLVHPVLVRPKENGGYEMIAGHRRKMASELAGLESIRCIVRELSDDEAIIAMVDSNIQHREDIRPSEKAKALKMRMDAMQRQGQRNDLTSRQVGEKLTADEVGKISGDSARQVQRYIRLNELIPSLQNMVDDKKMAFNPAVELSFLDTESQKNVIDVMQQEECTPSLSQAQRIKKYYQEGKLDRNVTEAIMSEEKPQQSRVVLPADKVQKYFPKGTTPKEMEDIIFKLLEQYRRRNLDRGAR